MTHPWHGVPATTQDGVHVYVETTSFDQVKYELDLDTGLLVLNSPQAWGVSPPFAYGIIPQTLSGRRVSALADGEDTDHAPLDVFVFSDQPLRQAGVLVRARCVGGTPVIDRGLTDHKIFAVVSGDPALGDIENIDSVPRSYVERIEHYLRSFNPNHDVYVGEPYGRVLAEQLIKAAVDDYTEAIAQ